MICPNCGKINSNEADKCQRCHYDLTEIKANSKYCKSAFAAKALCAIVIFGLAKSIYTPSGINASDTYVNIIVSILVILTLASPLLAITSRLQAALAQGKLHGITHMTTIIAIAYVVIAFGLSIFEDVYGYKYDTISAGKSLFEAIDEYAAKNDGLMPADDNWIDKIYLDHTYNKKIPQVGFAINPYIAGQNRHQLPEDAVIAFETKYIENSRDSICIGIKSPESLEIYNGKHANCVIVEKSGSASQVRPEDIANLNWMNTAALILPPTIKQYIARKSAVRLIINIAVTIFIIAALAILIYLDRVNFLQKAAFLTTLWAVGSGSICRLGNPMHNQFSNILYIFTGTSILTAVLYCVAVERAGRHLKKGYLRNFNISAAMLAGVLCVAIITALVMLIDSEWNNAALIGCLPAGIVGGGIMGIIANNLVFRRMLKWQPINNPTTEQQPLNNGDQQ